MTSSEPEALREPYPTDEMLSDPVWEAIWQVVKDWDIRAPWHGGGYCGGTGSHATAIYRAIALTRTDAGEVSVEEASEIVSILRERCNQDFDAALCSSLRKPEVR